MDLQLDEHQYETETGPCLDALRGGTTVHAPDLRDEQRCGELRTVMLSHGVRGVLAVPLIVRNGVVGVLNLFDRPGSGFDERDQDIAAALAAHAAVRCRRVR